MLGVYDYTVILTYLSAVFAGMGIIISMSGDGHPYIGCMYLILCGVCDAFDGKVARTKKNRTEYEKQYGIQIDSLTDLVAFGALPVCIGHAMIRVSPVILSLYGNPKPVDIGVRWLIEAGLQCATFVFILAALIRLAHYNVTEEERQRKEDGVRKYYEGLPVTSSALIFPSVVLAQYLFEFDGTVLYMSVMLVVGFLFISKIRIPKPGMKGLLILMGVGLLEIILLFLKGGGFIH